MSSSTGSHHATRVSNRVKCRVDDSGVPSLSLRTSSIRLVVVFRSFRLHIPSVSFYRLFLIVLAPFVGIIFRDFSTLVIGSRSLYGDDETGRS